MESLALPFRVLEQVLAKAWVLLLAESVYHAPESASGPKAPQARAQVLAQALEPALERGLAAYKLVGCLGTHL